MKKSFNIQELLHPKFKCHCLHVCVSLLHVDLITFIFVASSLLKASSKFHYLCLLLHYFVVCSILASFHCSLELLKKSSFLWLLCFLSCFLLALHHCFSKFLEKNFFFLCGFIIFLSVFFLLSITTLQSFERGACSLLD